MQAHTTRLLLREFTGQVITAVNGIIKAICENDETAATGVMKQKDTIRYTYFYLY